MSDDVITIPMEETSYRIPKSIVDAISDIQQYTVMESEGISDIPEGYFTLRRSLAYVNIGFKYGLGDNFIVWFISPFLYGVLFNMFPIFGRKDLTLFDKIFAFTLSKYITVGLLTLMIYLLFKAKGTLSKGCSSSLISGYSIALLLRMVVFLFAYRYLYSVWPVICQSIYNFGFKISRYLPVVAEKIQLVSIKMTTVREILLITSTYETIFSLAMLLFIGCIWLSLKFVRRKSLNPYYGRFD